MNQIKILISILFLISTQASAADWTRITGAEGLDIHINPRSIVPAGGGLTKAWIRQSHDEVQASKGYPKFAYKSAILLYVFNCSERTAGVIQETYYDESLGRGEAVNSSSYSKKNIELNDVIPGSVGEGILEYACSFAKPKSKK